MQGIRLYYVEGEEDFVFRIARTPGAYGCHKGRWYCCTPNSLLGSLSAHTIEEHEDGSITVTPSILVSRGSDVSWHGYLTNGVWSES